MRNLHVRVAVPLAILLAANVAASAWITWSQLSDDVASSLESYGTGLARILVGGLEESMRKNDRDHIQKTMEDVAGREWVRSVRVFDMKGKIGFSSQPNERGQHVSKASETCRACHRTDPPTPQNVHVLPGTDARQGETLEVAEAMRADRSCIECHEVAPGRPLGVLVVDLDMAPLARSVKGRASRNLSVLLAGSAVLLACLVWILRTLVSGRLVTLGEAIAALRAGKHVGVDPASPVDEIDALEVTLAALGTDLEDRVFAADLTHRLEQATVGQRSSVLLVDAKGEVLLGNEDAQRSLRLGPADLAGRAYSELSPVRGELWSRTRAEPVAFFPPEKERRGELGAELLLISLLGQDESAPPVGYLEVGRRAPEPDEVAASVPRVEEPGEKTSSPDEESADEESGEVERPLVFRALPRLAPGPEDESDAKPVAPATPAEPGPAAAPRPRAARAAVYPEHFLHHPYVNVRPEGDRLLRAVLLLANLPRQGLPRGILDLDPTLVGARRVLERLEAVREAVEDGVQVCDATEVVRSVAEDWRRATPEKASWHVLVPERVAFVGHAVLLRQLVTILVEEALAARTSDLVVFVQPQRKSPAFFLGAWASGPAAIDAARWEVCRGIVERFGGKLEVDAGYDLSALKAVHPALPPHLGRGTLLVAELPRTLAQE